VKMPRFPISTPRKSERTGLLPITLMVVIAVAVFPSGQALASDVEAPDTESFLSDGGRVGAVLGSIMAGAATANPFAPLVGNVLGFVVGAYADPEEDGGADASGGYVRRSITPSEGSAEVPTLALNTQSSSGTDSSGAGSVIKFSGKSTSDQPEKSPEEAVADKKTVSGKPSDESGDMTLVVTKDVGGKQAELDALAATIRQEQDRRTFKPHPECPSRDAPKYRKSVAVTAFTLETPREGAFGSLYNAGETVSDLIYQKFKASGNITPYYAPTRQMFASLDMAPTRFASGNGLEKYSAVSREMGVQFVVAGVIRDMDVSSPDTWDSSYYSNAKRALFGGDLNRAFVVDVVVYDGFTGHVVMERRYAGDGRWEFSRREKVQFGSDRFMETHYGQAVDRVIGDISTDIVDRLACQPMLVEILNVDGKDLVLDVGTESGLLPGTYMRVVRKEHSLRAPEQPPQLWDTGVELHVHKLNLNSARAWMPQYAGAINIQPGDYAVLY
jgi:hypothetical protein